MTTTQRAVLIRAYGGVAAAEVAEIARPAAGQGQVLSLHARPPAAADCGSRTSRTLPFWNGWRRRSPKAR